MKRKSSCRWSLPVGRPLMLLMGIAFGLQLQALAAVPTYTGCYSASSGTINKLAPGFSPQKPCNSGDIQVSFSAGDITKISVSGGLSGGGDNGDVTITLDPKYSLPQSCPENYIAKWNGTGWACAADENTTYTNGTGLSLNGTANAFGILPGYRLPQSCPDGSIAQATGGNWTCATPAQGTRAYAVSSPDKALSNFESATVATLTVPSGKYVVIGKLAILNNDSDPQNFSCRMEVDGTTVDGLGSRLGGFVNSDGGIANPIQAPLLTFGTVNQTISVSCQTFNGEAKAQIVAIPLTAIN